MDVGIKSVIYGPFKTDFIVIEDDNGYGYIDHYSMPLFAAKEMWDSIKECGLEDITIETKWGNQMPNGDWETFNSSREAYRAIHDFFKES